MIRGASFKNWLERIAHLDKATLITLAKRFYGQREFFQKILNLIQDGIIVIDSSGRIELINTTAETMLNLKDIGDMILWKCIPELLKQVDIQHITEHSIHAEVRLTYPASKILRFYSVPIEEGDTLRAVCVFADITQHIQKKACEIEEGKIESVALLSAGIAHEIGNPLNSIALQLELMKSDLSAGRNDAIVSAIDICRTEVDRLNGIIKNFLQALRPVTPNLTDADVLELLHFVVKFLSPELMNDGVEIRFEVDGEIPLIIGDTNQLKQVFFNIIKNAVDAMTTRKQLTIQVSSDDEHVLVAFCDTGEGMSDVQIQQVFTPFVTSKAHGSGLGMFIVQRILREHGASITIESHEHQGTKIVLSFPRKIKNPKQITQKTSHLIADD